MLLRSEAGQLVGKELINALSDFKQLAVPSSLISSLSTIQFFCEGNYCGVCGGHSEFQSPSVNQDKMLEANCQGGSGHVDKEVDVREEEEVVEC
jgi:hypothetical protein